MNFKQANKANFRTGRQSKIQYLVIHYTANNGDTAAGNASYFANNKVGASAHFFVDEDEVWQSVKESDIAWHCGSKKYKCTCRNSNSIGIEMCSRKDESGKYYFMPGTLSNTVKLAREIIKKYNIPAANVIRHYDVTGKTCPAPFVIEPQKWTGFKDWIIRGLK